MRARGWSVATSWAVVILWTIVSVSVAIASLTALTLPTWFLRTHLPPISFGVWWWSGLEQMVSFTNEEGFNHLAKQYAPSDIGVVQSRIYKTQDVLIQPTSSFDDGHQTNFKSGISRDNFFQVRWSISGGASVWILVGALYGGAAVVVGTTALGGPLLLPLLKAKARIGVTRLLSNMQAAAVSVQVLSLMLYPLGLGSEFARSICGNEATIFWSGDCTVGYGYFLAMVATGVAAYCPILARLITYRDYSPYWSSINYL